MRAPHFTDHWSKQLESTNPLSRCDSDSSQCIGVNDCRVDEFEWSPKDTTLHKFQYSGKKIVVVAVDDINTGPKRTAVG